MPPWKPEPGYGAFIGERRLSDADVATLQQWAATGAVEGDPGDLPPAPQWQSSWQLGTPDLVVQLPEYTLRADGLDVFRNFVVRIPVTGVRYVTGLEFSPGNTPVHHANIRLDPTPASRQLDDADPEPGYEGLVLNSAKYPDGYFLGWTPGQIVPLAPAALHGRFARAPISSCSCTCARQARRSGFVRPSRCTSRRILPPAIRPCFGWDGRTSTSPQVTPTTKSFDTYTLPVDVEVQAIQPHSHYRARTMSAWATLPDRTVRWLIMIPQWDFGWQDAYRYAAPFWLAAGSTIFTEYDFDNSSDNPANPASPPVPAVRGFRSSDEMADVWIQVLTRSESDREHLVGDFRIKADVEDITGYETQIRRDPSDVALHNDVAVLYLETGQPGGAISHFELVTRLQPQSARAQFNLASALEAAGRFEEAIGRYRPRLRSTPTTPAHM